MHEHTIAGHCVLGHRKYRVRHRNAFAISTSRTFNPTSGYEITGVL